MSFESLCQLRLWLETDASLIRFNLQTQANMLQQFDTILTSYLSSFQLDMSYAPDGTVDESRLTNSTALGLTKPMQQQLFKIYSSFAVDDSETSSVRCGLLPTSREMASFYFDERSAVLQCLAALHRLSTDSEHQHAWSEAAHSFMTRKLQLSSSGSSALLTALLSCFTKTLQVPADASSDQTLYFSRGRQREQTLILQCAVDIALNITNQHSMSTELIRIIFQFVHEHAFHQSRPHNDSSSFSGSESCRQLCLLLLCAALQLNHSSMSEFLLSWQAFSAISQEINSHGESDDVLARHQAASDRCLTASNQLRQHPLFAADTLPLLLSLDNEFVSKWQANQTSQHKLFELVQLIWCSVLWSWTASQPHQTHSTRMVAIIEERTNTISADFDCVLQFVGVLESAQQLSSHLALNCHTNAIGTLNLLQVSSTELIAAEVDVSPTDSLNKLADFLLKFGSEATIEACLALQPFESWSSLFSGRHHHLISILASLARHNCDYVGQLLQQRAGSLIDIHPSMNSADNANDSNEMSVENESSLVVSTSAEFWPFCINKLSVFLAAEPAIFQSTLSECCTYLDLLCTVVQNQTTPYVALASSSYNLHFQTLSWLSRCLTLSKSIGSAYSNQLMALIRHCCALLVTLSRKQPVECLFALLNNPAVEALGKMAAKVFVLEQTLHQANRTDAFAATLDMIELSSQLLPFLSQNAHLFVNQSPNRLTHSLSAFLVYDILCANESATRTDTTTLQLLTLNAVDVLRLCVCRFQPDQLKNAQITDMSIFQSALNFPTSASARNTQTFCAATYLYTSYNYGTHVLFALTQHIIQAESRRQRLIMEDSSKTFRVTSLALQASALIAANRAREALSHQCLLLLLDLEALHGRRASTHMSPLFASFSRALPVELLNLDMNAMIVETVGLPFALVAALSQHRQRPQAALTAIRCLERSNVELLPLLGKYAHKLFAEVLSILSGADLINEAVQSACWKLVATFQPAMFQALLSFQSNSNLSAPKDAPDTPQLLSILLPTGSLKRPSNFPQDFAAPKWHSYLSVLCRVWSLSATETHALQIRDQIRQNRCFFDMLINVLQYCQPDSDLRARAGVLALHTQCFKLFSLDLVLTDKQTQMLDRQAQTLNSEVLDFIKQIVKQCQHNHKQASALRHKEHIVRLSTIVTDMEAVLAAVESESRSLSAGGPVATSASSDHCARAVSLACESVSLLTRSQTQSVGSDPKAETNLARDAERASAAMQESLSASTSLDRQYSQLRSARQRLHSAHLMRKQALSLIFSPSTSTTSTSSTSISLTDFLLRYTQSSHDAALLADVRQLASGLGLDLSLFRSQQQNVGIAADLSDALRSTAEQRRAETLKQGASKSSSVHVVSDIKAVVLALDICPHPPVTGLMFDTMHMHSAALHAFDSISLQSTTGHSNSKEHSFQNGQFLSISNGSASLQLPNHKNVRPKHYELWHASVQTLLDQCRAFNARSALVEHQRNALVALNSFVQVCSMQSELPTRSFDTVHALVGLLSSANFAASEAASQNVLGTGAEAMQCAATVASIVLFFVRSAFSQSNPTNSKQRDWIGVLRLLHSLTICLAIYDALAASESDSKPNSKRSDGKRLKADQVEIGALSVLNDRQNVMHALLTSMSIVLAHCPQQLNAGSVTLVQDDDRNWNIVVQTLSEAYDSSLPALTIAAALAESAATLAVGLSSNAKFSAVCYNILQHSIGIFAAQRVPFVGVAVPWLPISAALASHPHEASQLSDVQWKLRHALVSSAQLNRVSLPALFLQMHPKLVAALAQQLQADLNQTPADATSAHRALAIIRLISSLVSSSEHVDRSMIFIASNLAHVLSFSPALLAAAQRPYTVDPNHHARAHIEPAFSDAEVADMATEYMRDMNIKQSVEQYRPHLLAPLHAVLMAAAELLLCAPLEAQWMFAEHVCVPALAFFSTLKHHECFDVATMQTFMAISRLSASMLAHPIPKRLSNLSSRLLALLSRFISVGVCWFGNREPVAPRLHQEIEDINRSMQIHLKALGRVQLNRPKTPQAEFASVPLSLLVQKLLVAPAVMSGHKSPIVSPSAASLQRPVTPYRESAMFASLALLSPGPHLKSSAQLHPAAGGVGGPKSPQVSTPASPLFANELILCSGNDLTNTTRNIATDFVTPAHKTSQHFDFPQRATASSAPTPQPAETDTMLLSQRVEFYFFDAVRSVMCAMLKLSERNGLFDASSPHSPSIRSEHMLIAADMQSYSLDQLQTEASSEWLRMPMGMLIALIRSLLQVIYPLLRVEQSMHRLTYTDIDLPLSTVLSRLMSACEQALLLLLLHVRAFACTKYSVPSLFQSDSGRVSNDMHCLLSELESTIGGLEGEQVEFLRAMLQQLKSE